MTSSTEVLRYRVGMAPPSRPLKPGAKKVAAKLAATQRRIHGHEEGRLAEARNRAAEIEECLDAGYTLKAIGEILDGVSPQRVQQMRTVREATK